MLALLAYMTIGAVFKIEKLLCGWTAISNRKLPGCWLTIDVRSGRAAGDDANSPVSP